MGDEDSAPGAEYVGVDIAPDADRVQIETISEALLVDGYEQARVCVRIGSPGSSTVSLTLAPADARAFRDDLSGRHRRSPPEGRGATGPGRAKPALTLPR